MVISKSDIMLSIFFCGFIAYCLYKIKKGTNFVPSKDHYLCCWSKSLSLIEKGAFLLLNHYEDKIEKCPVYRRTPHGGCTCLVDC